MTANSDEICEDKFDSEDLTQKDVMCFKVLKGQLYYNAKLVNSGHVLDKCQNNNGCIPDWTFLYDVLPFPS